MNKNSEHTIDNLLYKSLGKDSLEEPPKEFVADLLTHINSLETEKNSITQYTPPISVKAWTFIGFVLIIGFLGLFFLPNQASVNWSWLTNSSAHLIRIFNSIAYSEIIVYSVLWLTVFFVLDILLITKIKFQ